MSSTASSTPRERSARLVRDLYFGGQVAPPTSTRCKCKPDRPSVPHSPLPTRRVIGIQTNALRCQSVAADTTPSLPAILINPTKELAFIFRITLPRCALTVISEMPSIPPTCLFNQPEATND